MADSMNKTIKTTTDTPPSVPENLDFKILKGMISSVIPRKIDYEQKTIPILHGLDPLGNATLQLPIPPVPPEPVQFPTKFQETIMSSYNQPDIPAKFREAENQDISLLLVGMCIFCYAFVFYMIGWCAERRKPSSNNNNSGNNHNNNSSSGSSSSSNTNQNQQTSAQLQRDRNSQQNQDDCYPDLRNEITSFVSFYAALGINFDSCSRNNERTFSSVRNTYFDRPPRYNDLTDVVIDFDFPEAETPPPSYTQVVANDRMQIYQLRQM